MSGDLRDEAITVLRRVEFHLMNDEEGSPTDAAEKVLDVLLGWLDTNAERVTKRVYDERLVSYRYQQSNARYLRHSVAVLRDDAV